MIAPEHAPTFFAKVDPLAGPLEAKITPRSTGNISTKSQLHGRIIDHEKKPVPQAVVSVEVVHRGNLGMGNPPAGTDPMTVSDDDGNFALYSLEPFDAMTLKIAARAMAPKRFASVRPGAKQQEFVVTEGAGIKGRVLLGGKPVKDLAMGAVSVDRTMENFTGDFEIATQEDGTFHFPNLPEKTAYVVYGLIDSTQPYGSIPARRVSTGGDGNITQMGDIEIVAGRRLAGEVKLSDGKALPQPTRLTISRHEAWNSFTVELPADGRFNITNLPAETLSVGTRVPGYRPSGKNVSLDRLNPFGLVGKLDSDKTNLVFLLEPGEMLQSEWSNTPPNERPENLPLAGIENGGRIDPVIRGRILDAENGEPVNNARVTPGRAQGRGMWVEWLISRTSVAANGGYEIQVPASKQGYRVRVMAENYLPHVSEDLPPSTVGLVYDVKLKRGEGPRGTLVNANAEPISGLTIYHLGPMEQGSLNGNGELFVHQAGDESKCVTDSTGVFRLPAKLGDAEIYAANQAGFLRALASEAKGGKLALQPWAHVKGRLMENGKPAAGVNVDIGWREGFDPSRPHLNMHGAVTDENGDFAIERVPPGELHLTRRVTVGAGGGWSNTPIKAFTAKPGEEISLGEIDRNADIGVRAPTFRLNPTPKID